MLGKNEESICVCVCVLQWQLVFSVINDVLCDLISASEDQRLFQLDLVKVAMAPASHYHIHNQSTLSA